ncbi:MAG: UDP-N-acetylmuramoyl-tripeptide--D-alanyl-D-alanine ligase [Candidatus Saganbacteria bacterium]|nr:UDP-N-acetylmuramoyl-tripeptide--D-alanyl-D-alanine ligase [Candidatus Saganbacteria bacterium]
MFTIREILRVVKGAKVKGQGMGYGVRGNWRIKGVSTDSRTVKPGELFIPLRGSKFDGRKFIPAVLKKGGLVLDVKDGLKALQTLAACHRSKFNIPVIGVTGSVGKTTTKEMIASIISREMPVLKNEENFNNEIGVPLTLLKLTGKHKAAVIEMGMQGLGEIKLLAKLARPTVAVVTNIGEAHLEYLKTKKNVARAKAEIFSFLRQGGWAVINQDDEYFEHLKSRVAGRGSRVKTFGILEMADVGPAELAGIKLPLPGEHIIYDALAALAVAKILGLKPASLKAGLEDFHPAGNRLEVLNCADHAKIINDTYNANPQSMAAALKVLVATGRPGSRRIAVLGDMLELGRAARPAHRRTFRLAQELRLDKIFTFGRLWPRRARPEKSKKILVKKLKQYLRPRDIILVKGSRGTRMEEVVDALRRPCRR